MPRGKSRHHKKQPGVFDISKPHRIKPSATGRPVIVGHHPAMPDPMVTEHRPLPPQSSPPPSAEPKAVPIKVEDDNKPVPAVPQSAVFTEALAAESREEEPQEPPPAEQADAAAAPSAPEPGVPAVPTQPGASPPAGQAGAATAPADNGLPKAAAEPATSPDTQAASSAEQTAPPPAADRHDLIGTKPLPIPKGAGPRSRPRQLAFWTISILLALLLIYVLLDAKIINNNLNLPVHLFKNT